MSTPPRPQSGMARRRSPQAWLTPAASVLLMLASRTGRVEPLSALRFAAVTFWHTARWVKRSGRAGALISPSEYSLLFGGLPAANASAFSARLADRDAAHGGLSLFLDLFFTLGSPEPKIKSEASFHRCLHFVVVLVVVLVGCLDCY